MANINSQLTAFLSAVPQLGPTKIWVQKIYSTAMHLAFSLRFPHQTKVLYIARSTLTPLIGWGSKLPPPAWRGQDRFLDYVRAFTRGCSLSSIQGNAAENMLGLCFYHGPQLKILLFFWHGPELYFVGGEILSNSSPHAGEQDKDFASFQTIAGQAAIFCSWQRKKIIAPLEGKIEEQQELLWMTMGQQCTALRPGGPIRANHHNGQIVSTKSATVVTPLPDLAQILFAPAKNTSATGQDGTNETGRGAGESEQKAAIKFLQKKIKNIEADLDGLKKWRYFFDLVQRPDFIPPEEDRWKENGVLFKFQGRKGFQKVDLIYQKIKRWKAAEALQIERLATCYQELKDVQRKKADVISLKMREPMWADRWEKTKKAGKKISSNPSSATHPDYLCFRGPLQQTLWLGKSAAANDWLRHQRSKEDWWVHLENYPSAHAFFPAAIIPDTPWLTLIASLLRDTAHLTITEIPIIYTKVKNLRAIKGQAGGVIFKKEKHLRLPYQDWQQALQEI